MTALSAADKSAAFDMFDKIFVNDPWSFSEHACHLVYMLKSVNNEYKQLSLKELYNLAKDFNNAHLNFSAVLSTCVQTEEARTYMKRFVAYHNELVDELVRVDGSNVVQKHYLTEIT